MTDVTPEMIEAGARALCRIVWGIERDDFGRIMDRAPYCQEHDGRLDAEDHCECGTKVATAVLIAATPLIDAAVREQVARELEAASASRERRTGRKSELELRGGVMTDIDALIREAERHQPDPACDCDDGCPECLTPHCYECRLPAPCLARRLVAALRSERERVEAVRALHKPEKRWQTHKDHDASYDSREEALEDWCECDGGCACKPTYFEVCVECGLIESGDDPWLYRESLWPCPTARALGIGGE